jgi:tetratricopeptide (TPR) repeat protein
MHYRIILFSLTSFLFINCHSKSAVLVKNESKDLTSYQIALNHLSNQEYNQAMVAIDKVILENDTLNMEKLYFFKGFILHAYGETKNARAAYRYIIDNATEGSNYKKRAQQLRELNIAEEKWMSEFNEKEPSFTQSVNSMEDKSVKKPFNIVAKQPRFPSCPDSTNVDIKKCSNRILGNHIRKSYNVDIGETLGVDQKVRTYVSYTIGTEGEIVKIDARSSNKFLTLEAKRVIYTIPKMIPGESDGNKVNVTYQVPITYNPV